MITFLRENTKRAFVALVVFIAAACGGSDGGSTKPAANVQLSVSIAGNGHITSLPVGIDCSASNGTTTGTCTAQFPVATQVSLQAVAANGQLLAQWSGACSGATSCDIALTAPQTVSAVFNVVQRTVKLAVGSPNSDDGIVMMTFVGPSVVAIRPRTGIEIVARETTLPSGDVQTTIIASGAITSGALGDLDVRGGPAVGSVTGAIVQVAANASGHYARRTLLLGYTAALTP